LGSLVLEKKDSANSKILQILIQTKKLYNPSTSTSVHLCFTLL
jgi:hypothetical protein